MQTVAPERAGDDVVVGDVVGIGVLSVGEHFVSVPCVVGEQASAFSRWHAGAVEQTVVVVVEQSSFVLPFAHYYAVALQRFAHVLHFGRCRIVLVVVAAPRECHGGDHCH